MAHLILVEDPMTDQFLPPDLRSRFLKSYEDFRNSCLEGLSVLDRGQVSAPLRNDLYELYELWLEIKLAEFYQKEKMIEFSDERFLNQFREFEISYLPDIVHLLDKDKQTELLRGMELYESESQVFQDFITTETARKGFREKRKLAAEFARRRAKAIDQSLEFLYLIFDAMGSDRGVRELLFDWFNDKQPLSFPWVDDFACFPDWDLMNAIEDFSDLRQQRILDLEGILTRRALVPLVLIPNNASGGQKDSPRQLLLRNLSEAQKAYIHGVPIAALAILRSVLEGVLREYYCTNVEDRAGLTLQLLIDAAEPVLPQKVGRLVWARKAHELRNDANWKIHIRAAPTTRVLDPESDEGNLKMLDYFILIRNLIEGIPEHS